MKAITNGKAPATRAPGLEATPQYSKRTIVLNDPNLSACGFLNLTIKGSTPLIMHRFSEKARDIMLGKQMGKATGKKPRRDPEDDFLQALYVIGERPKSVDDIPKTTFGVPAIWFKQAAVRGAKINDVAMTDARCAFFVHPTHDNEYLILTCSAPVSRMDPVRIQQTSDLRIRPMFVEWSVSMSCEYNARLVSAEQLVSWFIAAGKFNGVGDWRVNGRQSTGSFGCFNVVKAEAQEPKLNG